MKAAAKAGALCALVVFLIGFMFGTIRVLLIVPWLGETAAVLIEAPFMLVASWLVCRWSIDRLHVRRTLPVRSLMGAVAFVVLIAAEFAIGGLLFGRSISAQLAAYGAASGAIGLAGQLVFATFPVVQIRTR